MMPTPGRSYQDMDRVGQNVESQIRELHQPGSKHSNKRKRESPGVNGQFPRPAPTMDHHQQDTESTINAQHHYYPQSNGNEEYGIQHTIARHVNDVNASSTAAAALAANMPQLNVPRPTELSFPSTNSGNEDERQLDSSFDMGPDSNQQPAEGPYNLSPYTNGDQAQNVGGTSPGKPAVGTEEWHKVRKDNHKEVERRRRETINEGINELAKIVPGCDKNKGAILQRGVQYISQLKENEIRNIEKWNLEKMLTDQAIAALTTSVDGLKEELARSKREAERWKTKAEAAGINVSAEETATEGSRSR